MLKKQLTAAKSGQLGIPIEASVDGKVVPLRLTVLPRHRKYLDRWVEAGSRMGLLDADVSSDTPVELFIWVREKPDPAYFILSRMRKWVVLDYLHGVEIGAFRSFEEALYAIRPAVLPSISSPHK